MAQRLSATLLAFTCALVMAGRAEAQNNTHVGEFNMLFFSPTPDLVLQSGDLTAATGITNIDFVEEFGIERTSFPEIRFTAGRSHKFRFRYVPVTYEAETTIQRTITFRGQTFTVGVPASTDIDWDIWTFGYQWDFVSLERGFAGLVVDLKYNTLDASIASTALATPAATAQKAPIPTIGIAGRGFPHPMVSVGGEFSGLTVNSGDFEASAYDFDINGAVTFGRHVGVQGGYRSITVDFLIDDDLGDLKLQGPYVGAVVRF
jgi:hypothetical protein